MAKNNSFVNYVDPNLHFNDDMGTYGMSPVKLEDLSVFVQLKVDVPKDVIQVSDNSEFIFTAKVGGSVNETNLYVDSKEKTFTNIVHKGKYKDDSFLTTDAYDKYTYKDIGKYNTHELFGLESLEISYRNFLVPEVVLHFTDVKGASLALEEKKRDDRGRYDKNTNLSASFFKCFMALPYPRFRLFVKGYYGQPVSYDLMCQSFNIAFESSTGNYKCTARMVGYSFALISDVSVASLLSAPYCDKGGGRQYWEDEIKYGRFVVDGHPMPKLLHLCAQWKRKMQELSQKLDAQEILTPQKINNVGAIEQAKNYILSAFNTLTSLIGESTDTLRSGWWAKSDGVIVGLTTNPKFTLKTNGVWHDLQRAENTKANLGGSVKNLIKGELSDSSHVNQLFTFTNEFLSSEETNPIFWEMSDSSIQKDNINLSKIQELFENDTTLKDCGINSEDISQLKIENSINNVINDNHINDDAKVYVFVVNWKHIITYLSKSFTVSQNENYTQEIIKQQEINSELTKLFGFEINLKNITKIIFAHLETFLSMYQTVKGMGRQNTACGMLDLFPSCYQKANQGNGKKVENEVWIGDALGSEEPEVAMCISLIEDALKGIEEENIVAIQDEEGQVPWSKLCAQDLLLNSPFQRGTISVEDVMNRAGMLLSLNVHTEGMQNPKVLGEIDAQTYIMYNRHKCPPDVLKKIQEGAFLNIENYIFSEHNVGDKAYYKWEGDAEYQGIKPIDVLNDNGNEKLFQIIEDVSEFNTAAYYTGGSENILNVADRVNVGVNNGWASSYFSESFEKYINGVMDVQVVNRNGVDENSEWALHKDMNPKDYKITNIGKLKLTKNGLDAPNAYQFIFKHIYYHIIKGNGDLSVTWRALCFLVCFYKRECDLMGLINAIFSENQTNKRQFQSIPYIWALLIGGLMKLQDTDWSELNITTRLHTDTAYIATEGKIELRSGNEMWKHFKHTYRRMFINLFNKWRDEHFLIWEKKLSEILDEEKGIKVGIDDEFVDELTNFLFKIVYVVQASPYLMIGSAKTNGRNWSDGESLWNKTYGKGGFGDELDDDEITEANFLWIPSEDLKAYLDGFHNTVKKRYQNQEGVHTTPTEMFGSIDMRINVYNYCKQIWDRWLIGNEKFLNEWDTISLIEGEKTRIHFIDSFYNQIGDVIPVNIGKLVELINQMVQTQSSTVLSFLSFFYQDNNCILQNIQNFLGTQKEETVKSIFQPQVFPSLGNIDKYGDLVVMYHWKPAMDANEGFNFDDNEVEYPLAITSKSGGDLKIPAFGVVYGMQNQNYFTDIAISTDKPAVTEQVINTIVQIASENMGKSDNNALLLSWGQDYYTIYSQQSYQCTVSMMGCALIQPLMYFQLLNLPMFRGAYIIHKVTHSISSNDMKTQFVGTKVSKISPRVVEESLYYLKHNLRRKQTKLIEGNVANIINDCSYSYFNPNGKTTPINELKEKVTDVQLPSSYHNVELYKVISDVVTQTAELHKNDSNKDNLVKMFLLLLYNIWSSHNEKKIIECVKSLFVITTLENKHQYDNANLVLNVFDDINTFVNRITAMPSSEVILEDVESDIQDALKDNGWSKKSLTVDLSQCINGWQLVSQIYNSENKEISEKHKDKVKNYFFVGNCVFVIGTTKLWLTESKESITCDSLYTAITESFHTITKYKNTVVSRTDISNENGFTLSVTPLLGNAVLFDMVLQTYYPYIDKLQWVYNGDTIDSYPSAINVFLKASNSTNKTVLLQYGNSNNWLSQHQGLHENFYISLMKRYEIQPISISSSFKDDCKMFNELTSQDSWEEKVCDFFYSKASGACKDVKILACGEVMKQEMDKIMEENSKYSSTYQFVGNREGAPRPDIATKGQVERVIQQKQDVSKETWNETISAMIETAFTVMGTVPRNPNIKGRCAEFVQKGLRKCGIDTNTRPGSACQYKDFLEFWGFKQVFFGKTSEYERNNHYKYGDIIVTGGLNTAGRDERHGHIQMYNARHDGKDKWWADKRFQNADVYRGNGERDSYLFRWPWKDESK